MSCRAADLKGQVDPVASLAPGLEVVPHVAELRLEFGIRFRSPRRARVSRFILAVVLQ